MAVYLNLYDLIKGYMTKQLNLIEKYIYVNGFLAESAHFSSGVTKKWYWQYEIIFIEIVIQ